MRRNLLKIMQAMHVIYGKPSFASNFLISLINSCGYYEPLKFRLTGDGDSRACVAWTVDKRTGEKMEGPAISIHMVKFEGWYDRNGSKWKTVTSDEVRSATFGSAKRDRAYEETSVDRYLARVVEVLLSVE